MNKRIIIDIKAMSGNHRDGDTAVAAVTEQRSHGLIPPKEIGVAAYSDGSYRKDLKENDTEVAAPLTDKNTRAKGIYPKSMFLYNEKRRTKGQVPWCDRQEPRPEA